MDTFDVDKLMRYDVLKEDWESKIEADRASGKQKPSDTHARDDTTGSATTAPVNPPPPSPPTPTHNKVIASPEINSLRRGQRLEFAYGTRKWCAVYWGKDDEGHVIAHKTFKDWALTHLDLNQYIGKLSAESEPDRELVQSIEQCLCEYERRVA